MKALVIKIRDAGFFRDPRISGSQDKMMDINGKVSRFDKRSQACTPYLKVPAGKLSFSHVANLLRVLWGERPVPHIRKVHQAFAGDPFFEDLAKKVRVKIDSVILPPDKVNKQGYSKHKNPYYPEETTTVRKSIGGKNGTGSPPSNTATRTYILDGGSVQIKGGLLYPDRLRRFIGDVLFVQFNNLVQAWGGAETTQKGIELLNVHKGDKGVIAFCADCVQQEKKSLSNIIQNVGTDAITIHSSISIPLNLLLVCGGVDLIEKFSATLYVPVSDKDLKRIEAGTGVATFLEGGFATITDVEDWSELLELGTELTVEGELCT